MKDPQNSYDEIISRLVRFTSSQARLDAWGGILLSFGTGIAVLLLGMLCDQVFVLSQAARRIIPLLALTCFLTVLSIYTIVVLIKRPDLAVAAERLEAHFPQFKARLITTVQLWSKRRQSKEGYSPELIEVTASEAAAMLGGLDLRPAYKRRFLIASYRAFACSVFLALIYSLIFPASFHYSWMRLLDPASSFGSYASVSPGSTRLVRGSDLEVDVHVWGRTPLRAHVLTVEEGGSPRRVRLERRGHNRFSAKIARVSESFSYCLISRGVKSPDYQITILDRPAVVGLNMKYIYPGYTHLPPAVLDEGVGDISGLVGTRVILNGRSNVPLSYAAMIMDDSTVILGSLKDNNRFEISTEIVRDGSYHMVIRDPDGNENDDPIHYRISAIDDEYPTVSITQPGRDMNMPRDMTLRLLVSAADDFGLSRFYLISRKGERQERTRIANLRGKRSEAEVSYDWDLSDAGLLPGDIISYHVEGFDNDTYSGPKKSSSGTFQVRFPTLEEIYKETSEEQDLAAQSIERMLPEQRQLKERLEELRKELAEHRSLSWEEKQSVEEVIKRQEELAEKVEEVSRALENLLERMDNSFIIDQEMFAKMQKISELMSEIESQEMREAMERIREAMKKMQPEDIKKAMSELLINQEELDRRLERTLEILKRLKQEQEMKRLAEKASEIERRHQALTEETEKGGETERLAREEEELSEDLAQMKKDMESLAEELRKSDPEISEALKDLSKAIDEENLSGQMTQVSQMLAQGKRSSASGRQKNIQKHLSSLAQGLEKAHSDMLASRTREIDKAMKEAQNDLLDLSDAQEELNDLIDQMEGLTQASPGKLAQSQQALGDGVTKVAEKLYGVAQRSFFLTSAIGKQLGAAARNMEGSTASLESGDMRTAKKAGLNSVASLNNAVKELMKSRQSLRSCSSPGGISEAMEKLSGMCCQQMGINQGVQSMLMLNPEGGGLSMAARAQIARLAAEQRMIADQLQQIAKGLGKKDQLLGDLDALAREAEEAAKALDQTDLSRKLVERQERILSRLLDAQRSLRKRDYSPKRKAEAGQDMPWVKGPGGLPQDLGEKGEMTQKDLLKALKEAYPKDYEKLIRAYFKSLAK